MLLPADIMLLIVRNHFSCPTPLPIDTILFIVQSQLPYSTALPIVIMLFIIQNTVTSTILTGPNPVTCTQSNSILTPSISIVALC